MDIRTNNFRSAKLVEAGLRSREKQRRRDMMQQEKEKKRERKNFLTALLNHQRDFTAWHKERLRQRKRIAGVTVKKLQDMLRDKENHEKAQQKERLKALRNKDEEGYMKLLKETKNERLLTLLQQTEDYMKKLGATIKAEQERDARAAYSQNTEMQESAGPPNAEDDALDFIKSRKKYYAIAHSIKEEVTKQPTLLKGGDLREYQLAGLQWMLSLYNNRLNGILADEMGLGKTVQSVALIAYLMEVKKNNGPFLFIVPMSTLHNNWEYEFNRWLPTIPKVVYDGSKGNRKRIRENDLVAANFNVLLTTYEFAMRDKKYLKKFQWEYIIVDEAHRLKNPKCRLAQDLVQYSKYSRRIALTGTPLQNDLPELWSLLNFLHPAIFDSCDTFEHWFSSPFEKMGLGGEQVVSQQDLEMTEEEKLLVIDRLHSIVRPFMLRREKKEVETQLLDKIERVLRCEMSAVQQLMYRAIDDRKVTLHNPNMQLRKVCNHPYLFFPYSRGIAGSEDFPVDENIVRMCGKFMLLDQLLRKLQATGHRVLIFNQMTKTMDVIERYLQFRQFKYLRLDGNTNADLRQKHLQHFNDPNSEYFVFMLSTKAGGLGINLQSADTVILFDSDWNPQNDNQAEARAHRIGQKNQVITIRLISIGTVEEKVLNTARNKLNEEAVIIRGGMFNSRYNANKSREMVRGVLNRTYDHEAEIITSEAVSKAISRSDEEYHIFKRMDKEMNKKHSNRLMDENEIPMWVIHWLQNGSKATSCDLRSMDPSYLPLVQSVLCPKPANEEEIKTVALPELTERKKKAVSYKDVSDGELNEEEEEDDDDEDDDDAPIENEEEMVMDSEDEEDSQAAVCAGGGAQMDDDDLDIFAPAPVGSSSSSSSSSSSAAAAGQSAEPARPSPTSGRSSTPSVSMSSNGKLMFTVVKDKKSPQAATTPVPTPTAAATPKRSNAAAASSTGAGAGTGTKAKKSKKPAGEGKSKAKKPKTSGKAAAAAAPAAVKTVHGKKLILKSPAKPSSASASASTSAAPARLISITAPSLSDDAAAQTSSPLMHGSGLLGPGQGQGRDVDEDDVDVDGGEGDDDDEEEEDSDWEQAKRESAASAPQSDDDDDGQQPVAGPRKKIPKKAGLLKRKILPAGAGSSSPLSGSSMLDASEPDVKRRKVF